LTPKFDCPKEKEAERPKGGVGGGGDVENRLYRSVALKRIQQEDEMEEQSREGKKKGKI